MCKQVRNQTNIALYTGRDAKHAVFKRNERIRKGKLSSIYIDQSDTAAPPDQATIVRYVYVLL